MKTLLISAVLTFSCLVLHATTWYVSNSGSNSNNGLSPGSAFLTIQFAEDNASAGDSILVANGSYAGFYVDVTGSAANPIVFLAMGNDVRITSPTSTTDGINVEGEEGSTVDYIEINGFIVNDMPRNGIRLVWANHCTVRNCQCDNNFERGILTGFTDDLLLEFNICTNSIDEHGIYVSNSSDRSVIRYNMCHHNNGGGIQINADASLGGDGIATDPQIYGNVLYENGVGGGAAINLDGVQGAFIYNNLIYENHATGIALFQIDGGGPSMNAVVVHNTIVQAANGRWCLLIVDGATGAKVYNNILINQHPFRGSIAISADAFTGFDSDYNLMTDSFSDDGGDNFIDFTSWQGLGYDAHSFLGGSLTDLFVNPGSSDYHLQDDGDAVDAGNGALAQGVSEDIEGNPRPSGPEHDLGAYEAQIVLALEEEEHNAREHAARWMTMSYEGAMLVLSGLQEGDLVSVADVAGKLLSASSADIDGGLLIDMNKWPVGIYFLSVWRHSELLGSRSFFHVTD